MALFTFKKKKDDGHYLSGKEIRRIAAENRKVMRRLEARRRRKADESEFLSEMKDERNILEIEDLHTYFFTEQGVVKAVGNEISHEFPVETSSVATIRLPTFHEAVPSKFMSPAESSPVKLYLTITLSSTVETSGVVYPSM